MATKDDVSTFGVKYQIADIFSRLFINKISVFLMLLILIIFFVFPIYWTFASSIKTLVGIHAFPPELIPRELIEPVYKNYTDLWTIRSFNYFTVNSLIVALTTTVIVVIFGTLAGYGFSRFRFRYDNYVFIGILAARLLPPIGMLVPFYQLFAELGLINSRIALVMVYTYLNLPLVVWLMRNYFISIPGDIDEAAYVDGATRFQTFKDVILPLAKPGVAAVAILTFLFSWREFLFALVLTFTNDSITLPVGAMMMVEDVVILWNYLAAAGAIAMVPALLFVVLFQRHIVSGLTAGAVKG
jgi:multiple sugar transport system permease protein